MYLKRSRLPRHPMPHHRRSHGPLPQNLRQRPRLLPSRNIRRLPRIKLLIKRHLHRQRRPIRHRRRRRTKFHRRSRLLHIRRPLHHQLRRRHRQPLHNRNRPPRRRIIPRLNPNRHQPAIRSRLQSRIQTRRINPIHPARHNLRFNPPIPILIINPRLARSPIPLDQPNPHIHRLPHRHARRQLRHHFNLHPLRPRMHPKRIHQSRKCRRKIIRSHQRPKNNQNSDRPAPRRKRFPDWLRLNRAIQIKSPRQFRRLRHNPALHQFRPRRPLRHKIHRAPQPILKIRKRMLQSPRHIRKPKPRHRRPHHPPRQKLN